MKKAIAAALVLVGGLGAYSLFQRHQDAGEQQLVKHIWLERKPHDGRDVIDVFVVVKDNRRRQGVFHRGSAFKYAGEKFFWNSGRGELAVEYPQSGEREKVGYRVTSCREGVFTLCLELTGNTRGVHKYRSNDDLVIGGASVDVDAALAKLRANLRE